MTEYWLKDAYADKTVREDPDLAGMREDNSFYLQHTHKIGLSKPGQLLSTGNLYLHNACRAASLSETLHSKSRCDMGESGEKKFDVDKCLAEWKTDLEGSTDLKGRTEMWDKRRKAAMQLKQATQSAVPSTTDGMEIQADKAESGSTRTAVETREHSPSVEHSSKHSQPDSSAPDPDTEIDCN